MKIVYEVDDWNTEDDGECTPVRWINRITNHQTLAQFKYVFVYKGEAVALFVDQGQASNFSDDHEGTYYKIKSISN